MTYSGLHFDELRKQQQLESWQQSEEQNVPLGYGLANAVEGGIQRGVGWLQEQAEDDPDTWTDDALRLMGGGLKNISNIPGMGLIGKVGEAGGYVGGGIAEMMGVDRRIGQFAGSMAADAALGAGIGKVAQIGKTTARLRRLRYKGAPDFAIEAAATGKYSFAYGDKPVGLLDDIGTAAKTTKTQRRRLGKLEEQTLTPKRNKLSIDESMVQKTPAPDARDVTRKYRTDDFTELDDATRDIIIQRNKDIDSQIERIDGLEGRLKAIDSAEDAFKNDPYYMRTRGPKQGVPRTKARVKELIKGNVADTYRRITDYKVRSLASERMFWSNRKGLKSAKGMERHHLAGLAWSEPFFDGLNATQANELRDFAKKYNVFFGDDLNNRIDLSKAIHTGNKAKGGEALNIHSWLNDAGYSHKGLNLSGASMEVRKAKMAEMIDQVFRQKLKLTELQLMDINDLKTLIPPDQFKKYQKALREIKGKGAAEKMITFNVAKANLSSEFKKNLRKQLNLNKRSEIKAIQRDVVGR